MKVTGENKEQLNAQQREAVELKKGPALVVAGAGTGKTRVIVERIFRLIENGVDPHEIVALTFTEKAAQEMLDRLNELRGGYTFDVNVMTYNAFGEQILRRFATDIGLNSSLTLLGDVSKLVFLRDNFEALKLNYYAPVTQPDRLLDDIARYFSALKQQLVTVEKYDALIAALPDETEEQRLEKNRHQELKNAFAAYRRLCAEHNVIDYDDQIYLLIELLRSRPNVLKRLKEEYKYLLVDEFQDTNPMQSVLLDMLCSQNSDIMVVGDDDQSIYAFRGATVENILNFKERYPAAQEVILTKNYRSSQSILDTAYRLIRNNDPHRLEAMHGFDKRLQAEQLDGSPPAIKHFADRPREYRWVCDDIMRRIEEGQDPGTIAVLARRNATIQDIHAALDAAGIEHTVAGQTHDLFREPVIKALIDTLKAVVNPFDDKSIFHALSSQIFADVDIQELSELSGQANRNHEQLAAIIKQNGSDKLSGAVKQLEAWREQAGRRSAGQLSYDILSQSGLKDRLVDEAQSDAQSHQAVLYLAQFFDTTQEFERIAERTSPQAFIESLPLITSTGENASDDLTSLISSDSVSVMTIHKAKGLEWDTVYIIDLVEGSFPMKNFGRSMDVPPELASVQSDAGEPMREERRLMYVAMTRAKRELLLTYSAGKGQRPRRPSRFLSETLEEGDELDNKPEPASEGELLALYNDPTLPIKQLPAHMQDGRYLALSVSQLGDYFRCPYDFYYRHVLKVPTELSPTLLYGSAIHKVIESWHQMRLDGKTPDKQTLLAELASHWPERSAGFQSAGQHKEALESARKTIERFLEREKQENRLPKAVEEPFIIRLDEPRLIVRGRFDAIYDDGGVEIRDYKTGESVTDKEKAKRNAQGNDQLTLYALAWQQMHGELPKTLSLDFVDTGFVGSVSKRQQSIDTMTKKLHEAAEAIRTFDFPLGRDHRFCRHDD